MAGEADVLETPQTLAQQHVAQALALLAVAKRHHDPHSTISERIWPDVSVHHHTLSVIMHGFAALEGHVNRLAYALLQEEGSPHFVKPQERTYEFRDLVSKWDGQLGIDRKIEFLLERAKSPAQSTLLPRVRELTLLRNWVVHGKVYHTAVLVERSGSEFGSGIVHLRADGQPWTPKFPHFKFPMPDQLSYPDARNFFLGCCEAINVLSEAYKYPFIIILNASPARVLLLGTNDAMTKLSDHIEALNA